MDEHGLTQFKLEIEGSKLEMKKGAEMDVEAIQRIMSFAPPAYAHAAPPMASAAHAPSATAAAVPEGGLPAGEVEVKSILVGTFFRSSSPEADPYVTVGSEVSPDSVVCIVEAMKVMNQITAGVKGKITKCLVENGTPVQYGDVLFHVKTA